MNVNQFSQSLIRQAAARLLSGVMPYYIVNEYPKSGGTWLGQMISDALIVPFKRNAFLTFEPSIVHGHFLHDWGMKNIVVIWRDGRDVMVSWYHHCLFEINEYNAELVKLVRDHLGERDYENVKENLPDFIDFSFNEQKHPSFSWSEFVQAWHGKEDVVYVRYEDLLANGASQLQRIVYELHGKQLDEKKSAEIIDKYSFANMSGRKRGAEDKNSFLRKGISGDWENYFNKESLSVFENYAGHEMRLLGYE